MSNRRSNLGWNINLGPLRFTAPVPPWMVNLLFLIVVLCCCCGPCVSGLFTE
ncbi:hypothetical protein ACFWC6_32175 [Micromonospora chalcea]